MDNQLELAEDIIKTVFKSLGATQFAIALSNVFCYGHIIEEVYGECNQQQLDHIDLGVQSFERAAKDLRVNQHS